MLELASALASAFACLHSSGVRDRETYSRILREALTSHPALLAAWTVWEPGALDGRDAEFQHAAGHDATGRFVACWHRATGRPELMPVVGYESPGAGDWYWIPKRKLAPCHLDPTDYCFGSLHVRITSRIAPVLVEGRFRGAVGTDFQAIESNFWRAASKTARAARAPAVTLRESRLADLSPREVEVLHWLGLGKSNDEIATILGISFHTVKNHLDHIFHKLGVHNRHEAIMATGPAQPPV
jgi:DNA-binding CsgD family transcriptional regulator